MASDSDAKVLSFLSVAVLVGGFVLHGFAIACLWKWFAVPVFGIREILVSEAVGFVLLARLVCPTRMPQMKDERSAEEKFGHLLGTMLFGPALVWGIGWFVHVAFQ